MTRIEPAGTFYQAEDYHQKYYLSQNLPTINQEMRHRYPVTQNYILATAVARANGYAGRHLTDEEFLADLEELGFAPADVIDFLHREGRGDTLMCPVPE